MTQVSEETVAELRRGLTAETLVAEQAGLTGIAHRLRHMLQLLPDEVTPHPLEQARAALADGMRSASSSAELASGRALLAVLRVTGAVVVGQSQVTEATSGEWVVVATPDQANAAVEFAAVRR